MASHQLSDDELDIDDYDGGQMNMEDGDHGYREVEIREQDRLLRAYYYYIHSLVNIISLFLKML